MSKNLTDWVLSITYLPVLIESNIVIRVRLVKTKWQTIFWLSPREVKAPLEHYLNTTNDDIYYAMLLKRVSFSVPAKA